MAEHFSTNYFGRHVDVYIADLPEPDFEGEMGLRFGSNVKVATGLQKLVQIYVITLFTAVGSKLLAPTEGTTVGSLAVGRQSPGTGQLRHVINIGNAEALDQILEDQGTILSEGTEPIPDDELLSSATPLDISVPSCDQVDFTVLLESAAGESAVFVIPLPLVPQG